jgi:putative mRNA 3-end processing factor
MLESRSERLLLDYGLKVETGELPAPPKALDAVLLAHQHLDHGGSAPVLYRRFARRPPALFATAAVLEQANLLWRDSIKVARLRGRAEIFGMPDVERLLRYASRVTFGQRFEIGRAAIDVHDAGHVPGSAMFVLEIERRRVLYTSDFNTLPTRLLHGARIQELRDIDVLIMESTYSNREHPPRKQTERKLLELVDETIANEGIAIIPVFAVGRAAEVLMVLNLAKPRYPVYLDGMAREATDIALHYPELLRDHAALKAALDRTTALYTDDERKAALKSPCVIITTGGCLSGGPAVMYIRHLYTRPECSLIFSGFQVPRTPGRYLLDTGRFVAEGMDLAVKMRIEYLDFSAHAGRSQLLDFVKALRPETVLCMHGDYCEQFATELKSRFGVEAMAPRNGDVIKI